MSSKNYAIGSMTAAEIEAEYFGIAKRAARASDAVFDTAPEEASRIVDEGDKAQKAFARRVRSFFFYRLPAHEIADSTDKGLFYPLSNGWRRAVDPSTAREDWRLVSSAFLRAAIEERANGADLPRFDDDE